MPTPFDFYTNRDTSRWLKMLADLSYQESSPIPGDVNAPQPGTVHGAARPSIPSDALPDAPAEAA